MKKKNANEKHGLPFWLRVGTAVAVTIPVSCAAVAGLIGWRVTHPKRKPVEHDPASWGLPREDVSFCSLHGEVVLKGWHIPPPTADRRLVVFAHGYADNRSLNKPTLPLAKAFHEQGIGCLLFDFRNSGESDPSVTSVGHFEKYDLLAALEWGRNSGYEQFVLVGFSMGAAASIVTAPDAQDVRAVVADSPFSDLEPYLKQNLRIWTKLPNFPFTPMIMSMIPRMTGIDAREVRPIHKIRELGDRRVLLIHNKGDTSIPLEHSLRLYAQADPARTELWTTDGDVHVGSYECDPIQYVHKVVQFVTSSFEQETSRP